jgi:hypothetical protein
VSDECSAQIYCASVSRYRKKCPSVNFTSTILYYELPCHACYIYRPTLFILSSCLTGQLIKSYVSLFCPKTLPEGAWSRDLNSSKHSSILFLVPLSHSFPSVILCTPLKCSYINVGYIGSSLVNWACSFAPGGTCQCVYVCMCMCMCVCVFLCVCVCMYVFVHHHALDMYVSSLVSVQFKLDSRKFQT